ncbi:MAG: hypothetical protein SFW09_23695 [Hyphomicrobiaceae bacterium]|nr:hypothetical protein [Hyphomicrobiaceae bacterium]
MLTAVLSAQPLPPMVQAVVVLGVGIFSTLLGFGLIPAGLDQKKAAAWRKRYAGNFRIGGPLVIVVGLVLLARAWLWPL